MDLEEQRPQETEFVAPNVVHHINNLPPEVLIYIFHVLVETDEDAGSSRRTILTLDTEGPDASEHIANIPNASPSARQLRLQELHKAPDTPTMATYQHTPFRRPQSPEGVGGGSKNEIHELKITHVCRYWRQLATETASLWTNVQFTSSATRRSLMKANTWIQRSKDLPLNLEITTPSATMVARDFFWEDMERLVINSSSSGINDSDSAVLDEISELLRNRDDLLRNFHTFSEHWTNTVFDIIGPHIARWRRFTFKTNSIGLSHLAARRLAVYQAAPVLDYLSMQYVSKLDDFGIPIAEVEGQEFYGLMPFQGNAPRLKNLLLRRVPIPWSSGNMFTGLTRLELASHPHKARPSFHQFKDMLTGCLSLTELSLRDSGPHTSFILGGPAIDSEWPDETIMLPRLTTLALSFLQCNYTIVLWTRLRFPNLKNLELDLSQNDDFTPLIKRMASLEEPNLVGLHALSLKGLNCRKNVIPQFLSCCISLRRLDIDFVNVHRAFLTNLCARYKYEGEKNAQFVHTNKDWFPTIFPHPLILPAGVHTFCPRLEEMSTSGVSRHVLKEFMQNRLACGSPLRRIVVEDDTEPDGLG